MIGWYSYSVVCELTGLILFLYGFFLMNYDEGKVQSESLNHVPFNDAEIKSHHISKTVLIVIDALRYDFVVGNDTYLNWPFLHSLIEKEQACVSPCRAYLPTVTMPRIKAMTVGDSSNFLDIVLNFGSSQIKHDNIIAQMKRKGLKIVFYGDDTWIKLFPNSFYRQDGVTSFFVSDFYEVDNIVTKNVVLELGRNDWDAMILHYLGLDHIGHVEGSKSTKISAKLQEMDIVVRMLHEYLLKWKNESNENYLLIICADHGMRNNGGHGGSTLHETLVPLVTIGMNCSSNNEETSQVDLAVTLSVLMGLPIPRESIGKVIPQFLEQLPLVERVDIHRRVTEHLIKKYIHIVGPLEPGFEDAFANAHLMVQKDPDEACKTFQFLSHRLSSSLVAFLTKFDIFHLLVGVVITVQAACLPLTSNKIFLSTFFKSLPLTSFVLVMFLMNSFFNRYQSTVCNLSKDNVTIVCLITSMISFNMIHLYQARKLMIARLLSAISMLENDKFLVFLIVGLFLQIFSTLSTSLIEEEHMYWYFLWTTWLILLLCQNCVKSSANSLVVLLALHRILKKFNQTGDQYASLPDIGDWFKTPEKKLYLTIFFMLGLLGTLWIMLYRTRKNSITSIRSTNDMVLSIDMVVDTICVTLVFLYRAAVGEVFFFGSRFLSNGGLVEIRIFKYLTATSVLLKSAKRFLIQHKSMELSFIDVCLELWIIVSVLLMRPHNVILPGALVLTSKWLTKTIKIDENKEMKILISHHWLAHIYFFYQGNSNSLATIDVASGYIGQSEFDMMTAGILITMSSYAMPVLAYMLMLKEIQAHRKNAVEPAIRLLLIFINVYVTFYLIVMLLQRHHLFIWSVFSPKLLYVSVYCLISYPFALLALFISEKR